MPRRKFIDKKNAQTFALVHRAQNDPLLHDENAPSMVFAEKQQPRRPTEDDYAYSSAGSMFSGDDAFRSKKVKQRGDLEEEFGLGVRANEGEAAEHGIFFDDSGYDYMQHMRGLGSGEGAVQWVEASGAQQPEKKKGKQKLEDALRSMDIDGRSEAGRFENAQSVGTQDSAARSLLPSEILPSEFVRKRTYQDQQDIPDELAGFQPDMDPELRAVLEALEDEAYVDDVDEDDMFGQLTGDGREVGKEEWEELNERWEGMDGEEDDGWESDDTVRAASPSPPLPAAQLSSDEQILPPEETQAPPPTDPTGGAWLDEFKKFKTDTKAAKTGPTPTPAAPAAPSALESSALSSLASGRRKNRKGAKTSTTNYSMTSSALARTAQQTLLDSRFDRIEEDYAAEELADDDEESGRFDDAVSTTSSRLSKASKASRAYSAASGMSGVSGISSYSRAMDSEAPQLQRADFDSIMDDFLGSYSKTGKTKGRVKRGGPKTGMEELDEVRKGLGPARIKSAAR